MDSAAADMLQYALTASLGFYQRADTIARLLTSENVSDVMGRLPPTLLEEFTQFARDAYVPRGQRFAVTGSSVPRSSLDALRAWLGALDTAAALEAGQFIRADNVLRSLTDLTVTGPLRDRLSELNTRVRQGIDAGTRGMQTNTLPPAPPPSRDRPALECGFAGDRY
jgi:hypothetical protein